MLEEYSICNFVNVSANEDTFLGLCFVGNYAIHPPVSSSIMCSDQFYYFSGIFKMIYIYICTYTQYT
jgi:hypothetical protein